MWVYVCVSLKNKNKESWNDFAALFPLIMTSSSSRVLLLLLLLWNWNPIKRSAFSAGNLSKSQVQAAAAAAEQSGHTVTPKSAKVGIKNNFSPLSLAHRQTRARQLAVIIVRVEKKINTKTKRMQFNVRLPRPRQRGHWLQQRSQRCRL